MDKAFVHLFVAGTMIALVLGDVRWMGDAPLILTYNLHSHSGAVIHIVTAFYLILINTTAGWSLWIRGAVTCELNGDSHERPGATESVGYSYTRVSESEPSLCRHDPL